MHEELNQFASNDVWFMFPKTDEMNIIGSKWVFKNKLVPTSPRALTNH